MFKENKSENIEPSYKKNLKSDWLKFSSKDLKDEFLNSLVKDNKFILEEMKIRTMVVDVLKKEFGENIENIKDYDFLVDSVINRIKNKQLSVEPSIELS